MDILIKLQSLFQRVTNDTVSCGTLAVFAAAMALLTIVMNILARSQLL